MYLLGVDNVHDHAALEHAGQTGLDLEVVGLAIAIGGGEFGGHGSDVCVCVECSKAAETKAEGWKKRRNEAQE